MSVCELLFISWLCRAFLSLHCLNKQEEIEKERKRKEEEERRLRQEEEMKKQYALRIMIT